MNKRAYQNDFLWFLVIIAVWVVIIYVLNIGDTGDSNDEDCLEKAADKFCDKIEMEYVKDFENEKYFKCELKSNIEDDRDYDDYEFDFYYLDKELEKCEVEDE